MDWREFLKKAAVRGAIAGAARWLVMPEDLWAMAP